jgi:hypothetical protein
VEKNCRKTADKKAEEEAREVVGCSPTKFGAKRGGSEIANQVHRINFSANTNLPDSKLFKEF